MKKCGHCGGKMKKSGKCMKCGKMQKSLTPDEKTLLKSLDALEKAAIPAQMRDADGGFATEGDHDELQVSAEEGEPKKVKKSKKAEASEESSEESSMGKGGDDEESSDEEHSPAETSSPELSADDDEESIGEEPRAAKSKGKSVKKSASKESSIKKSLMSDEGNRELLDASSFLENLVDQVSDAMGTLTKSVNARMGRQDTFNKSMAGAVINLGNLTVKTAQQMRRIVKALENVPESSVRTQMSKSQVHVQEREFVDAGEEGEQQIEIGQFRSVLDKLTDMAVKGTCPPAVVTDFELHKSMAVLPENIRQLVSAGLH